MYIDAAVTLLPLRQDHLSPAIDAFCDKLSENGLDVGKGEVNTLVRGDMEDVFEGIKDAYNEVLRKGDANLVVVFRNF